MAESLDAVSLYFRAIKDYPELSREAFNTLWRRADKGDKAAKKELIERNLRLVVRDSGIVLQGCVRTYHAKQLAQQAVMEAGGLPILANE